MSNELGVLVGKSIEKVLVDADRQHWIRFVTDSGTFDYFVDGDCCSESWIWAVSGARAWTKPNWKPSNGEVCKVQTIDEIELPQFIQDILQKDGLGRQDSDQFYGFRINGSWGLRIEFEFRNSSNGYYGGGIQLMPKGAPPTIRWVHVEDDWTCGQKPTEG